MVMENEKNLESIIESNYEKLYAYAFRMVGNHQDTEDVLQNSFIRAFKGIKNFRNESSLDTWLYRIIVNESYRNFERIKKLPITLITENLEINEVQFFEQMDYEPRVDDELIIEEMREKCLTAFMKCIPKNQRVCFLLKTCLELSYEEIAEVMDISVSNVKVTLFRGRKRLQELFNMRCNLIDPNKPCKCHLWIKYMNDNNYPLPSGNYQIKSAEIRSQHFKNMKNLQKIDYLYSVEATITKEEFLNKLKKLQKVM